MGYQVERLRTGDGRVLVVAGELRERVDRLMRVDGERYRRLWAYCRNPMRVFGTDGDGAERPYRQAQEWGLPSRITGARSTTADVFSGELLEDVARKEVVIENDIGWRVDTMVMLCRVYGNLKKRPKQPQWSKRKARRSKPYRLKPVKAE